MLKEVYPVKEILSRISKEHFMFNGDFVYMGDKYYEVIANSDCKCSSCGLRGAYFVKEKNRVYEGETSPFRFGLYGQNKDGEELRIVEALGKLKCIKCLKEDYEVENI